MAGLGLATGCGIVPPQLRPPARVPRVGILGNFQSRQWEAFRKGLHELGYVENQSIVLEERWTEGVRDRFPVLAADLVALNVDVIVAAANPGAQAAIDASSTIPVVSPNLTEAVSTGLVASLAQPGANLTGLSMLIVELDPKRLELLKGAIPTVSRVTYLGETSGPASKPELHGAARALGLELRIVLAPDLAGLDVALQSLVRAQTDALLVDGSALLVLHRGRILDAAAKASLPAMYPYGEYPLEGGLMFYGPNQPDLFYRAAGYVDRILKGTSPADIPVELPTKFDFVINLKTAQALGLTIPQSVLLQATELIQ